MYIYTYLCVIHLFIYVYLYCFPHLPYYIFGIYIYIYTYFYLFFENCCHVNFTFFSGLCSLYMHRLASVEVWFVHEQHVLQDKAQTVIVGSLNSRTNSHGFELPRPSIKGAKLSVESKKSHHHHLPPSSLYKSVPFLRKPFTKGRLYPCNTARHEGAGVSSGPVWDWICPIMLPDLNDCVFFFANYCYVNFNIFSGLCSLNRHMLASIEVWFVHEQVIMHTAHEHLN